MFRKHLALMTAIVVVGLVGLLGFASVAAQSTPSATRSFDTTSVAPGGQVVVTVAVSGYGAAGALIETLPDGFSYVSSTHSDAVANGREVSFTLFGETSVTYTVEASQTATAGDYSFSGEVRGVGDPPPTATVGGATDVTVEAGTTPAPTAEPTVAPTAAPAGSPSGSRSFSPSSVAAGGQVDVTVSVSGYGSAGALIETLPAGFSFVSSTHSDATASGQEVSFTLLGDSSVTYTVRASQTAGRHAFSGEVRGIGTPPPTATVGGATNVTVTAATGGPSGSRSFSPSSVTAGGQVDVTVSVSGYGSAGALIETLPAGFSYVSSTHSDATASGQEVSFTLLGDSSVTYTVRASQTAGRHAFSGEVRGIGTPPPTATVGGATNVTVTAATGGPSASRSFSPSSVERGAQFTVTVAVSGYGSAGALIETLPAGFSYVSSTHSDATASGQEVSFTLLGDSSVTYTVRASQTAGRHAFSGEVRGIGTPPPTATVGGATSVTVTAPVGGPTARRSFSPAWAPPGGQVTVTVAVSGYGAAGALIETLPAGFSFVSSTHSDAMPDGQQVSFTLFGGETSVTYIVQAPQTTGTRAFSGEVRDLEQNSRTVSGTSRLSVGAPPPTPTPRPSTGSGGGSSGGGGGGSFTPAPTATPTPTATPVPQPTATPAPAPTATPVPPAPTATPVPPTATPVPTATPTPTATPVPPAPTATPAPRPTATPTPTATPVPPAPAATATPVPTATPTPTATPVPPAPPVVPEDEGGIPIWLIVLIVLGLAAVVVVGSIAMRSRQR